MKSHIKFEPNRFISVRMHVKLTLARSLSPPPPPFFFFLLLLLLFLFLFLTLSVKRWLFTLIQRLSLKIVLGCKFKLLAHHIKFHPDDLKSVQENEVNSYCSVLTFWLPVKVKVTESGIKWQTSMVPINVAGVNKFGGNLCAWCSKLNFLLGKTPCGRLAGQTRKTDYIEPYFCYLYRLKKTVDEAHLICLNTVQVSIDFSFLSCWAIIPASGELKTSLLILITHMFSDWFWPWLNLWSQTPHFGKIQN